MSETIPPATALVVEDIHKSFGSVEVLKGVSVTAHDQDVIAILGSSGSGKSTFLRCINLLEMPDKGRVHIKGELIEMRDSKNSRNAANPKQIERLRSRLAMVFQQFNLWAHMTVLQNVIEAPIHVLKLDRKNGETSVTPASAAAIAWPNPKISVRLQ